MASPNKTSTSGAALIGAKLSELDKKMEDLFGAQNVQMGEIILKLTALDQTVKDLQASGGAKRAPAVKKDNSTTSSTPTKKNVPGNSMLFFRRKYKEDRDAILKEFNSAQRGELDTYMNSTPDLKAKVGDARKDEESKWLWTQQVKPKTGDALKAKFKAMFEEYKKLTEQSDLTPASKEEDI